MKSKKGLIITAIAAVAIIVLTIIVVIVYRTIFQTPQVRLLKGITNTVNELSSYSDIYTQDNDIKIVQKKFEKQPISLDTIMNLTVGDADTVGIDTYTDYDYEKKKMQSKLELSIFNIDLVTAYLEADNKKLLFSVPEYMEDTYYINTDKLGHEFNNSAWSSLFYTELPDELTLDLFPGSSIESNTEDQDSSKIEEQWKKIKDEMVIKNCKDTMVVKCDGRDMTCRGVVVSFPGELLNPILERYTTVKVKDQIVLHIYLDSKNRIVALMTPDIISLEGSYFNSFKVDIEFNGSKRTLDKCKGIIELVNPQETYKIEVERRTEENNREFNDNYSLFVNNITTKSSIDMTCFCNWNKENQEFLVNASVNTNEDSYECKVEGSIGAEETNTRVSIKIGDLEYIENENRIWKVTGSIDVSLCEDEMDIPKDGVDFFQMNETEAINLVQEIYLAYLRGANGF